MGDTKSGREKQAKAERRRQRRRAMREELEQLESNEEEPIDGESPLDVVEDEPEDEEVTSESDVPEAEDGGE